MTVPIVTKSNPKFKLLLLLPLLLGLPSPLFASSSTSGYKMKESCESDTNEYYYSLWEKKSQSVKWKLYKSEEEGGSYKLVSKGEYDQLKPNYEDYCR